MLQADPTGYARNHQAVDGEVTHLAPYITHGLVSTAEVMDCWRLRCGLSLRDKLCLELAWREFFHHVWRHRGEDILDDMQKTAHAAGRAPHALPVDIRMGATGIPVIDRSVRALYATGYLHNHQRLWLASYCVHVRKLPWRSAADWMYAHLLDGDLASNHLSWQWVAGTFSHKPYVFNNENVRRYAPELDSPGSAIDHSYAEMEALAASDRVPAEAAVFALPVREPALWHRPPRLQGSKDLGRRSQGAKIALLHPWSLLQRPQADLVVGVIHLPFHARFPWSAQRWDFVTQRMQKLCDAFFVGDLTQSHTWLERADIVAAEDTLNFEYASALRNEYIQLDRAPQALPEPGAQCASFSAWLKVLMRTAPELFDTSLAGQLTQLRRQHNGGK